MNLRLRAALFATVLLFSGCAAPPSPAQASFPGGGPASFAPLVQRVVPAVVNISVIEGAQTAIPIPPELRGTPAERLLRERLRRQAVRGAGAGFIIDPAGVIVTNSHVVGHASRITVTLADGRELPGQPVGVDELTDLAVIRVTSPSPLPSVSWGDSRSVEVGDWVLAAGNPFGVGTSVTAGIVSARGRDIGAGPFDDFIQIDAPINPGNSGGPTFNLNGEVIAVNTAIVSPTGGSVGIGFAVPSEIAQRVVNDLRQKGRIDRGWLGVSVRETETRGTGVQIAAIERTSPAARAGLRPGDVITAVNGDKVETSTGLVRTIAGMPPGGSARLSVRRGGQNVDVSVTVGRRPAEPEE
jgi:serine protease Do